MDEDDGKTSYTVLSQNWGLKLHDPELTAAWILLEEWQLFNRSRKAAAIFTNRLYGDTGSWYNRAWQPMILAFIFKDG
jgi:hypothetical protein